jgi:hypothetical protein
LADGTDVEILNILDDHSRLLVVSGALGLTNVPVKAGQAQTSSLEQRTASIPACSDCPA